uniref:HECT domain-containing protein n=1 Tax=Macrostomum lignano TaxID=282301 RepID=A0A1I8FCB9_9PLAT
MTQGGYTLAGAVDSSDKQQEELLEIDLIRHSGKPLGIEFLFGHLSLPRGPTSGLFVRRLTGRPLEVTAERPACLRRATLSCPLMARSSAQPPTEAAALEAIRKAVSLNCLVRSLNGGGVIGGSRRGPSAVDDDVDVAVHQRLDASPVIGRQSSAGKAGAGAGPVGYRFTAGELAELRNSVGGGGSGSVPFGQFVAAVSDIIGRRWGAGNQLEIEEAVVVPAAAAATSAAAPLSQRHRQSGGFEARDKLDVVDSGAAKQRPFVAATSTSTGSQTALTGPAQDAAVAAAKSEARELADQCAALQRAAWTTLRQPTSATGDVCATALQATLDLLGRLANLDQAERAEADAVAVRAAELLSNEGVDGNDDLPPGWEPAQLRPGGAEAAAAVFANHAEGRVARQPPAAGNSKRAEQEAEPEVDGPKRLQRYPDGHSGPQRGAGQADRAVTARRLLQLVVDARQPLAAYCQGIFSCLQRLPLRFCFTDEGSCGCSWRKLLIGHAGLVVVDVVDMDSVTPTRMTQMASSTKATAMTRRAIRFCFSVGGLASELMTTVADSGRQKVDIRQSQAGSADAKEMSKIANRAEAELAAADSAEEMQIGETKREVAVLNLEQDGLSPPPRSGLAWLVGRRGRRHRVLGRRRDLRGLRDAATAAATAPDHRGWRGTRTAADGPGTPGPTACPPPRQLAPCQSARPREISHRAALASHSFAQAGAAEFSSLNLRASPRSARSSWNSMVSLALSSGSDPINPEQAAAEILALNFSLSMAALGFESFRFDLGAAL